LINIFGASIAIPTGVTKKINSVTDTLYSELQQWSTIGVAKTFNHHCHTITTSVATMVVVTMIKHVTFLDLLSNLKKRLVR
jgi:maltodextrin utilization protein YvdJ